MKIGILTFHNAHNYGAVLQAFALRTVLRRFGHNVKILNYHNEAISNHYPKLLNTVDEAAQDDWNRQYQKFEEFIDCVLLENDQKILKIEDLKREDIDCFICGSDQIWNFGLTAGPDAAYFLNFQTNAKKISYAASNITASIKDQNKEYFREKLSKFDAISVREESFAKELMLECGVYVDTVLDPTLLLNAEDYVGIEKQLKKEYKYILAYYLAEDNLLDSCARKASDLLNLPLIEIHFFRMTDRKRDQIADCGPGEFLSYFRKAEYILTNSYHGVIFSLIFKRPFYAVYEKDGRKDNILKKLKLDNRHIRDVDDVICDDMNYQFEIAEEKLQEERVRSLKFIENALGV